MIRGLAILLACQLCGEVLSRSLALPVPGPVLGLLVLFALLQVRAARPPSEASDLDRAADGLLANLALLFVPAGVGVVQHLGLLREHGPALLAALVGSTVLALLVTVATFRLVARAVAGGRADEGDRA